MSGFITHFGHAVRHHRELRDWSQEQLAQLAGLNRSFLGEVERGSAVPSLATAGKLAAALSIPLSVLIAHGERIHSIPVHQPQSQENHP